MSAIITDADRAAAHEALVEKPITCDDMRPGISHDWICEDVAQAMAEVRERENAACAQLARDRASRWGADLESQNPRRPATWARRDEAMYLADRIEARRSR